MADMENGRFRVIIADDEAAIRNGLMTAIPWEQYHAEIAALPDNGTDALKAVMELKPDLAVMDIKMPGMDGLEVIRRAGEGGEKTRFLILSGYDDFALAQKAIRYGAKGYFLKPLKIDEFRDELSRQFAEIERDRKGSGAFSAEEMDTLMDSSRVFFLNQLIRGEIHSPDEAKRRAETLRIGDVNGRVRVAVVMHEKDDEQALSAVMRKYRANAGKLQTEAWLSGNRLNLMVFHSEGEDTVFRETLEKAMQGAEGRVYAGIGRAVEDITKAGASNISAVRAAGYMIYEVPGDVYDDSMVCRQEPAFSPAAIRFDPLLEAIKNADLSSISAYSHQFMQSLMFVKMPSPDYVRGMCIHLVNTAGMRLAAESPGGAPAGMIAAEEIAKKGSLREIEDWLTGKLRELSERFGERKETEDPLISRAKEYIREHMDQNIRARDVASVVNLSETYFTSYFKAKTGENFRDYVIREKMNLAMKLMKEKGMNVSEAAEATGYQDYRSFSRAFKNCTGMSPSEFCQ